MVLSESCSPTNGVIDPFAHVIVQFSLLNIGGKDATNVVATLLGYRGVDSPAAPHKISGTLTAARFDKYECSELPGGCFLR